MTTKRTAKKPPAKAGSGNLIKGARTAALPRMTDEQINRFGSGGMVDERIPEDKIRAVAGVGDPDAFVAFLAPRVGRYRSHMENTGPSTAEELAWTNTTMEFIRELQTRLDNPPQGIWAEADLACWKRRQELWSGSIERLNAELNDAWVMLALAERAVEPHGGNAGRKPSWARDELLTEIADWFERHGSLADDAARISRRVLVALDIPAPDKPTSAINKHRERLRRIGE
ncbi:MAG: hypothetical protein ACOH1V_03120 [Stenotrophomonas sp.]